MNSKLILILALGILHSSFMYGYAERQIQFPKHQSKSSKVLKDIRKYKKKNDTLVRVGKGQTLVRLVHSLDRPCNKKEVTLVRLAHSLDRPCNEKEATLVRLAHSLDRPCNPMPTAGLNAQASKDNKKLVNKNRNLARKLAAAKKRIEALERLAEEQQATIDRLEAKAELPPETGI